jgi:hypothetical protein
LNNDDEDDDNKASSKLKGDHDSDSDDDEDVKIMKDDMLVVIGKTEMVTHFFECHIDLHGWIVVTCHHHKKWFLTLHRIEVQWSYMYSKNNRKSLAPPTYMFIMTLNYQHSRYH